MTEGHVHSWRPLALAFGAMVWSIVSITDAHAVVMISSAKTSNMNCSGGVCSPTAASAVLNVDDLTSMLASSNVEVDTGSGTLPQSVKDIVVSAGFTWVSGKNLTLDAYRSVQVGQPVVVAGALTAVAINVNQGNVNGTLYFGTKGSLSFYDTTADFSVNGTQYTLVNSIGALASAIAANPSGLFALANAYDASKDGVYPASPIPTVLTGTFDGLGNVISNLSIDDPTTGDFVGLFHGAEQSAIVRNLVMAKASVKASSGAWVGMAIGWDYGDVLHCRAAGRVSGGQGASVGGLIGVVVGSVEYSSSSGDVRGEPGSLTGGLIGDASGEVQHVSSSATVSTQGNANSSTLAGGLVGYNEFAISNSHATGNVTSGDDSFAGGLVGGSATTTTITNSYATGNVVGGEKSTVGGLAGSTAATTTGSFATGTVTGGDRSKVGGFTGAAPTASLSNDYSLGAVNAGAVGETGGFAGYSGGIDTSYSIGLVSGGHPAGGFIGVVTGTFTSDYFDTTTSGKTKGVGKGQQTGVKALTDSQLKSALPSGFDPSVWGQSADINNSYPYLLANPPPQ